MKFANTALTLKDLPAPPEGKTGWPWTEQSELLPDKMPDGSEWPKISIVTPNYNYGHFIEETIRSILLQGYPNLEYIVIDGVSTDNSVEIIKKYEKYLAYWVSEKDSGQSNAINRGIQKSTGTIFNWINSDDCLSKNSLISVSRVYNQSKFDILIGGCKILEIGANNTFIKLHEDRLPSNTINYWNLIERSSYIDQPSVFINCDVFKHNGYLKENLHYVMDYDLYIRILLNHNSPVKVITNDDILSIVKCHSDAKTSKSWNSVEIEMLKILEAISFLIPKHEIKRLKITLNKLRIQTEVRNSLQAKHPVIYLLLLLIRNPLVLLSRFYWGAVKLGIINFFSSVV